jgi:hypothetical protein
MEKPMKYRVTDSFYSTELKHMHARQEFDSEAIGLSDQRAKDMVARGHLVEIEEFTSGAVHPVAPKKAKVEKTEDEKTAKDADAKAEKSPMNKAEPAAPKNKSAE